MTKNYEVQIPEDADIWETVLEWMRKNRFHHEVVSICGGLLCEHRFYKGGYAYSLNVAHFNPSTNTATVNLTV